MVYDLVLPLGNRADRSGRRQHVEHGVEPLQRERAKAVDAPSSTDVYGQGQIRKRNPSAPR